MWLCFNDGFVSAVEDRSDSKKLVIRARRRAILSNLFPEETISTQASSDYKYRVFIDKEKFARIVTERIGEISYPNFKDSVRDPELHDLYANFWRLHYDYQR